MEGFNIKLLAVGVAAALAFLYALAGVVNIPPGQYGVLVKNLGEGKGMQPQGLGTGMGWVDPFIYDVIEYDTRAHQYRVEVEENSGLESTTRDGQPINVDVSLEISLDRVQVPALHEQVGQDWYLRVVYPKAREAVREAT